MARNLQDTFQHLCVSIIKFVFDIYSFTDFHDINIDLSKNNAKDEGIDFDQYLSYKDPNYMTIVAYGYSKKVNI